MLRDKELHILSAKAILADADLGLHPGSDRAPTDSSVAKADVVRELEPQELITWQ